LTEKSVQLRFVGCGDAFGSGGRSNTCFHVTGKRANFLIDCGASSLPALKRQGVNRDGIDLILITHFHGDHFGGLPFLLLDAQFSRRTRPLVIAGPEGIGTRLAQVMEALFENSSKTRQRFDLNIVTLSPATTERFGDVSVTPFPVVHGDSGGPFLAYRIEAEGRTIAYTADTEWTETLVPLGRDADLLIAEAYTFDKTVKNHLSLKALEARLADIKPKRLILTHMSDDMLDRVVPFETASDELVVTI
jgi:ribonuclease BN (tRNA processing enzyme)